MTLNLRLLWKSVPKKVLFSKSLHKPFCRAKERYRQKIKNNKINVCACWWIFHVFVWRWLAEALTGVEDLDCSLALGKSPPTAPLMEDDSVERTRRQNRNYPDLLNSPLTFLWLLTELAQEYKRTGKWRRDEGEWGIQKKREREQIEYVNDKRGRYTKKI